MAKTDVILEYAPKTGRQISKEWAEDSLRPLREAMVSYEHQIKANPEMVDEFTLGICDALREILDTWRDFADRTYKARKRDKSVK
jgi:hypothetical protein